MRLIKLLKELKLDNMVDSDLGMWKDLESDYKRIKKSKFSSSVYNSFYLKMRRDPEFKNLTPEEGIARLEKSSGSEYIEKAAEYMGTTKRGLWYYLIMEYDNENDFLYSADTFLEPRSFNISDRSAVISDNEKFMKNLNDPSLSFYINFNNKKAYWEFSKKAPGKPYFRADVLAGKPGKARVYSFKSDDKNKLNSLIDFRKWFEKLSSKKDILTGNGKLYYKIKGKDVSARQVTLNDYEEILGKLDG